MCVIRITSHPLISQVAATTQWNNCALLTRAREGGEATSYFCIVRKCDSLAVFAVAYFDPRLAGCHLAAMGRAGDCVCRLQLWLVINILQNKVQFVQEAYLFIVYIISSCQCQYCILNSSEWPFNPRQIDQKQRISLQAVVGSGQRIDNFRPEPIQVISSILVTDPKWSRCINFCFSNNCDCYRPNRPRIVVIDHHNKLLSQSMHVVA